MYAMNVDIFSGHLRQFLGQARTLLGKATGNDHQIALGQHDQHIGQLQQAYGAAKYKAQHCEEEIKVHTETHSHRC